MAKLLLILTNQQLVAVEWRAGRAVAQRAFEPDADGQAAFGAYLAEGRKPPACLVVDLIEEDFRTDLVPHVTGRDRKAVLERKLGQVYRTTPYRRAEVQGREAEGRRDDRVLYTAITNPELVRPWVALLTEHRVPLAAICSAPLVIAELLRSLRINSPHTLLVTLQKNGGLRQSYFQRGEIKFSRLTPLGDVDPEQLPGFIAEEVGRTWQYLDSLRYFSRSEGLDVYLVCHPADRARLSAGWAAAQLRVNPVDIRDAAASVGLRQPPTDSDASGILLHLAASRPANHFATTGETRLMAVWRARRALYAGSLALLAASSGLSGVSVVQGMRMNEHSARLAQEVRAAEAQYRAITRAFPATPVPAETMRDAVKLYNALLRDAPVPAPLMTRISQVLNRFPRVVLDQFAWTVSSDPNAVPAYRREGLQEAPGIKSLRPVQGSASTQASPAQPSDKTYQVAVLEGAIHPFDGDYRHALEELNRLLAELNGLPGAHASALALPLDVDPGAALLGKSGPEALPAQARFALKLVWAAP